MVVSRWAPRSSKPVVGARSGHGGFDSHPLPPDAGLSCADAIHDSQYRKTRFCHPERVSPVRCIAARIQRRVSLRHGELVLSATNGFFARCSPSREIRGLPAA